MIFELEVKTNVLPTMQIEHQIRSAIKSGKLKPGEKLPSPREVFEQEDRFHPNDIAAAYRRLEAAGTLVFKKGRGTFVP